MPPAITDPRKLDEIEYHNQRALDRDTLDPEAFERKYPNKKMYSIVRTSKHAIASWMAEHCPGARALDYCCGQGLMTIELAAHGAYAVGVDISDEEIRTARKKAGEADCGDRTAFLVMDAEQLAFPANSFDAIICNGVLHHVDLTRAYPELARVLKPGGEILCVEALGYNPAINWYRRATPHLRTPWEIDHILTLRDVRAARPYFDDVSVRFFHLFAIAAIPFRRWPLFSPLLSCLEAVDTVALRIPGLQLLAWQMIFRLVKRNGDAASGQRT